MALREVSSVYQNLTSHVSPALNRLKYQSKLLRGDERAELFLLTPDLRLGFGAIDSFTSCVLCNHGTCFCFSMGEHTCIWYPFGRVGSGLSSETAKDRTNYERTN